MFEVRPRTPRRTIKKDGPHPIDIHVGRRLRQARKLAKMSQTKLGLFLGCTFQAVQKYEKGKNRITASTLYMAAEALQQPIGFFFEEIKK